MDQPARKSHLFVAAAAFAVVALVSIVVVFKVNFLPRTKLETPPKNTEVTAAETSSPVFVLAAACSQLDAAQLVISRKEGIDALGIVDVAQDETFANASRFEIKPGEKSISVDTEIDSGPSRHFVRMGYGVDGGHSWSETQQIRVDGCSL